MTFVRAYLRASTNEQDASRARQPLKDFADQHGLKIAAEYVENASGASLQRPKLFELIEQAHEGDILLTEQVDRLSRLTAADWDNLKAMLTAKRIRVVALDLPTSYIMVRADDFTGRMFDALNSMMLDMLAAISRKDYEDRRRRAAEGVAKVMVNPTEKAAKYRGKPENTKRNDLVAELLKAGKSWTDVQQATGVSRMTVAKVANRLREGG
ncbi:UNVERIFIED_ORG: DNA invertase Pin-like site-specific DNA recombinase [Rhizobium sophorae]|uniref:recombinase family protein n=1 Tax=Rhizobium leguminosarum TaxID=384 RepID=UPI001609B7E6|nr:recombinase family protein [Rhizobium leguminosarum]MBB4521929.1 DNA invertase Pin-like site-specific DNA recombinase [Rhizobium leguminosarum]MDH6659056.1 DNA invertase Pin-like site-specific DNA recombinase [Rhizobium sophorae]